MAYQEKDLGAHAQAGGVMRERPRCPGCTGQAHGADPRRPLARSPTTRPRPKGGFPRDLLPDHPGPGARLRRHHGGRGRARRLPGRARSGTYIQPIQQGSNVHLEFNLYYDPRPMRRRRGRALHRPPPRPWRRPGPSSPAPTGPGPTWPTPAAPTPWRRSRKVKDMLDPDGVLNRGKLCFAKEGVV